jgi:hypothetical protein
LGYRLQLGRRTLAQTTLERGTVAGRRVWL